MLADKSTVAFWADKVIMVSCSALLGLFFVHWTVDHHTMWKTSVSDQAFAASLAYYRQLINAPPFYVVTIFGLGWTALLSCGAKLVLNPVEGMLFDGGTMMLLLAGVSVYVNNFVAALNFLPTASTYAFTHGDSHQVREALLTIASSNLIIAVTLTGVLALQAAQGFSNRPPTPATLPVKK